MTKLIKLKKLFKNYKIDGYIVPKNDEFFSEYIPENKDNLKFISNFSGSFGFAIILKINNYLFVDGRYTLQAKIQSGKQFKIITIPNQLPFNILKHKKLNLGFDPRLHTESMLMKLFTNTSCKLIPLKENLISKIRVQKSYYKLSRFYKLNNKDCGQNSKDKIKKVAKVLIKNKINLQFISASENIAWLLNLRGADSEFTPIPNSYLILSDKKEIYFFCDLKKINKKLKKDLAYVKIIDIRYIEKFLLSIKNKKILLDENSCSIFFKNIIIKNNIILKMKDPIYLFKSIKIK